MNESQPDDGGCGGSMSFRQRTEKCVRPNGDGMNRGRRSVRGLDEAKTELRSAEPRSSEHGARHGWRPTQFGSTEPGSGGGSLKSATPKAPVRFLSSEFSAALSRRNAATNFADGVVQAIKISMASQWPRHSRRRAKSAPLRPDGVGAPIAARPPRRQSSRWRRPA